MQDTGNSLPSERLWNRVCLKLAITLKCISQVGTVTGYCGLSPVLFRAGAPQHHLWFMLVKVVSGPGGQYGGCTDGLCRWGLHGLSAGGGTASAGMSSSLRRSRVDIYMYIHLSFGSHFFCIWTDVTSSPYGPCLSWAAFLQHSTALSLRKFKVGLDWAPLYTQGKTGRATSLSRKVVQLVVTCCIQWSHYQLWPVWPRPKVDRHDWPYDHIRPPRLGITEHEFWTWPSTLLRLIWFKQNVFLI